MTKLEKDYGPWLMVSVLALSALLFSAPNAAFANGIDELKAGLQAVDTKDYEGAIRFLTSAIESDDLPAEALAIGYTWRAVALENSGNQTSAMSDFDAAIRLNPGDADAHLKRGNAYLQMAVGEESEATGAAESEDEDAIAEIGKLESDSKEHLRRAIADYGDAIRLNPKTYDAYAMRGQAYRFSDRCDEGIPDFRVAIKLNPDVAYIHSELGNCLSAQKQFAEAVDEFTRAIALTPDQSIYYIYRAGAYTSLNKFDDAKSDLATADRLNKSGAR